MFKVTKVRNVPLNENERDAYITIEVYGTQFIFIDEEYYDNGGKLSDYQYAAVDKDGEMFVYVDSPEEKGDEYFDTKISNSYSLGGIVEYEGDWEDSISEITIIKGTNDKKDT